MRITSQWFRRRACVARPESLPRCCAERCYRRFVATPRDRRRTAFNAFDVSPSISAFSPPPSAEPLPRPDGLCAPTTQGDARSPRVLRARGRPQRAWRDAVPRSVRSFWKEAARVLTGGTPSRGTSSAQSQTPQQRDGVRQSHERRAARKVIEDGPEKSLQCEVVAPHRQFSESPVPLQMTPHKRLVRIGRQPGGEEGLRGNRVALLVVPVHHHVRVVSVRWTLRDGFEHHRQSLVDGATLDAAPAAMRLAARENHPESAERDVQRTRAGRHRGRHAR